MQDDMITQIATALGIHELPEEDKKKLVEQFGEVALKAATVAVVEKLSVEKREEFAKLAEAGDPEKLKAFLDDEVPGHEALAKDAVEREIKQFKTFQATI